MWSLWIFLLFWANIEDSCAKDYQMNDYKNQLEISVLVEEQIQNYLEEVKRTLGLVTEKSKKKRSIASSVGRVYGAEVLSGFQELFVIPSSFPNDIILFTTSKPDGRTSWYAAALVSDGENPQTSLANRLALYSFDGTAWMEFHSVEVNGGVSLASLTIQGDTYIVVAEHFAGTSGQLIEGSNVYMFNETTYSLQYIQLLNTKYAQNVIMWERSDMNEAFVAVTTSQNSNSGESRYSTQSIVYHWLGGHFDIVDYIPTHNPRSIVQFNIRSFMFLAVANYQDNYGNTNIDSEIFRYDLNSGKFITYQKLRTNAAVDIQYFCFQSSEVTESFLIVANHFEKDDDDNVNYEANSIIYKLSDEEYFIPFQSIKLYAVKKWIPIVQNLEENGAFVLLAVCEQGVVSFQYDGWRFVRSQVQYSRSWFGEGISSIHTFHNGNQSVFTVANKNNPGNGANIFNVTFRHDSRLDVFYKNVEDWCEKTMLEIKSSGIGVMADFVEQAPKQDTEEIVVYSNLEFTDVLFNSVKTDTWFIDGVNVVDGMTESLNILNLQLVMPQMELDSLENSLKSVFDSSNTIFSNIDIEKATINCQNACNFTELNVGILNGEDMYDFNNNIIYDEGQIIFNEPVEFENLAVLDPLMTKSLNGHPVDSLIDWSQENSFSHGLVVNGSVSLKSGLIANGTIDGLVVGEKAVWVLNPGQPLSGVIKVDSAEVESLNIQGSLNGWNIGPNSALQSGTQSLSEVYASELILTDRVLNQVDFGNLNLMALKKEATMQLVKGNHVYNRMEADNVLVTGMVYQIVQPSTNISFQNPNEYFMLGKSSPDGVEVNSYRSAKQLVPDSIRLAAAEAGINLIWGDNVEYIEVSHNDSFKGNLKINGTVLVMNSSLVSEDLISSHHNISAKLILDKGLRLDETNIPVNMNFETAFKVNKMSVKTINNINMESLVPANANSAITVSGLKTFADGLILEGSYQITGLVNEVNVSQLVYDTLQCNNDQDIHGSFVIGNIQTNEISSKTIYLNNTKWENTTLSTDGVVKLDTVRVKNDVNVDSLTVKGKLSDLDIEYLLQDSAFVNEESMTVNGFKIFTDHLTANKLNTASVQGLDMRVLSQAAVKSNLWNASYLDFQIPIRVEHLIYTGSLDGIDSHDFGEWLMTSGKQEVLGQQTIRSVHAIGGITTKIINNIEVNRLLAETLRIDLNETIDHSIFNRKTKSIGPIQVDGVVQGLDLLKDTVRLESSQLQIITTHKTLLAPLTVNGSLQSNGKVSGFDLTEFCLRMDDNSTKFVVNNGSVKFDSEPSVSQTVNGYLVNELLENTWFLNENVTLNYSLQFSDAHFLNTILQEEINNIRLEELSINYLSKTMNQTWTGDLRFTGGLTVKNSLEAPFATVGRYVSGIKIDQFKDSVLLDGETQVIDGVLDFGNIQTNGTFSTTGLVNGLDLLLDVMRLDVPVNLVNAHKMISKVDVLEMDMPPRSKIQNVDIADWEKSAVKTSGKFVVEGGKSFNGPFHSASNIRVERLVNGISFDAMHIMHSLLQQTITGRKIFEEISRVYVKDLELSGFLNSINISDFFMNQMYTEGNFTITGSKVFSNALEANTVYLMDNYNLTEMELQLRKDPPYNEFQFHINKLNSVTTSVEKSLQGTKFFLMNYTRCRDLEGIVLEAVPIKNPEGKTLLVVTRPLNDTQATLSFMQWNSTYNTFTEMGKRIYYLKKHPTSLESIILQNGQRGIIIESEINSEKDLSGLAESILFLSNYSMNRLHRFTVPSKSLTLHFEDRQIKCYIITNTQQSLCQVYCYTTNNKLHKRPQFDCSNVTQASILTTKEAVYVVTITSNKTGSIFIWGRKRKQFNFMISLSLLNPVSVDTINYDGRNYIAVTNQHLVGNTTAESVNIYRLNGKSKELVLFQELEIVAPNKAKFALLPSSELVLYVLSENKATPFLVYVYRGIAGFQHLYTDATLPLATKISSVTDEQQRHFVILTNKVKAMVLLAHFVT